MAMGLTPGPPPEPAAAVAAAAAAGCVFRPRYELRKVHELRAELRRRGLEAQGTKRDLVGRLWDADEAAASDEATSLALVGGALTAGSPAAQEEPRPPSAPPASAAEAGGESGAAAEDGAAEDEDGPEYDPFDAGAVEDAAGAEAPAPEEGVGDDSEEEEEEEEEVVDVNEEGQEFGEDEEEDEAALQLRLQSMLAASESSAAAAVAALLDPAGFGPQTPAVAAGRPRPRQPPVEARTAPPPPPMPIIEVPVHDQDVDVGGGEGATDDDDTDDADGADADADAAAAVAAAAAAEAIAPVPRDPAGFGPPAWQAVEAAEAAADAAAAAASYAAAAAASSSSAAPRKARRDAAPEGGDAGGEEEEDEGGDNDTEPPDEDTEPPDDGDDDAGGVEGLEASPQPSPSSFSGFDPAAGAAAAVGVAAGSVGSDEEILDDDGAAEEDDEFEPAVGMALPVGFELDLPVPGASVAQPPQQQPAPPRRRARPGVEEGGPPGTPDPRLLWLRAMLDDGGVCSDLGIPGGYAAFLERLSAQSAAAAKAQAMAGPPGSRTPVSFKVRGAPAPIPKLSGRPPAPPPPVTCGGPTPSLGSRAPAPTARKAGPKVLTSMVKGSTVLVSEKAPAPGGGDAAALSLAAAMPKGSAAAVAATGAMSKQAAWSTPATSPESRAATTTSKSGPQQPPPPDAYMSRSAPLALLRVYGAQARWLGLRQGQLLFEDDGIQYPAFTLLPLRETEESDAPLLSLVSAWLLLSLQERYEAEATEPLLERLSAVKIGARQAPALLDFLMGRVQHSPLIVAPAALSAVPPPSPSRLPRPRPQGGCWPIRPPVSPAVLRVMPPSAAPAAAPSSAPSLAPGAPPAFGRTAGAFGRKDSLAAWSSSSAAAAQTSKAPALRPSSAGAAPASVPPPRPRPRPPLAPPPGRWSAVPLLGVAAPVDTNGHDAELVCGAGAGVGAVAAVGPSAAATMGAPADEAPKASAEELAANLLAVAELEAALCRLEIERASVMSLVQGLQAKPQDLTDRRLAEIQVRARKLGEDYLGHITTAEAARARVAKRRRTATSQHSSEVEPCPTFAIAE